MGREINYIIFSSNNKKIKKALTKNFQKKFLNNLDLNDLKIAQKCFDYHSQENRHSLQRI